MPRSNKALVTFTAGEWSPSKDARADLEKASAALRTCRNMIVDRYGGVFRRPGLKFISAVKSFAAISYVSFEGSGTLYGITEFGDLSDPPKKYRNLISSPTAVVRWVPGDDVLGPIKYNPWGRVNYNGSGTKVTQSVYSESRGNAGGDLSQSGTPPAGAPEWIGDGSYTNHGSAVSDTVEDYDGGTGWEGLAHGTWLREKQKKAWPISSLALQSGEDANSPAWMWRSGHIGSGTNTDARTILEIYAVAGSDVWNVYTYYRMTSPPTGSGPATVLYVGIKSGDQPVDASTDGAYLIGGNASGGPFYGWRRFVVPQDSSIRFFLTIAGAQSEQFPQDWNRSGLTGSVISDEEILKSAWKDYFYLPIASAGTEPDDEMAEFLIIEDEPIDFLELSGASGVTEGTEEWAETSAFTGGVTAESHSPINYTMRVVKSSYTQQNLIVGYTYPITLTYSERDIGGANANTLQEVVNVVASSASEQFTQEVVAESGRQRKLINATKGAGVAPVSVTTLETETLLWEGKLLDAGKTATSTEITAVDNFIATLRANSLLGAVRYVLPFVGNDIAAAMIPIYDHTNEGSAVNAGSFVDGDRSSLGLTGNGTSKYLTFPFRPNNLGASGNGGMGGFLFTEPSTGKTLMGYQTTSGGDTRFNISKAGGGNVFGSWGLQANTCDSGSADAIGHWYMQRNGATERKLFRDGSLTATNATSDSATDSGAKDIPAFCLNNSAGSNVQFLDATVGFFYFTNGGLTDTQVGELHTIFSALNTSLGRS